jgi:hypothetical protein
MNNYEQKHVHITTVTCYNNKEEEKELEEHHISVVLKYLN